MLSYQHIYHAGNKADVHKHLWLITVLDYLRQKDKPFTWIDTHAGRGLYDLQSPEAQKLGEYKEGVLTALQTAPPPKIQKDKSSRLSPVSHYENIIQQINTGKTARYYPGSALIAAKILRPTDRLFAFDLHPQESAHLKTALHPYKNTTAQQADGLERLLALLPPNPRRGGALIDPSYEIKKEYDTVGSATARALKKFPQGVFMIWYPLLKAGLHEGLKERCAALEPAPVIDEWIWGTPENTKGMYGSGMIIFNAPYGTAERMAGLKATLKF